MPVLRWPGATARYSHFCVPVETGTPPRRRKLHIPRAGLLSSPALVHSAAPPLGQKPAALGFLSGFGTGSGSGPLSGNPSFQCPGLAAVVKLEGLQGRIDSAPVFLSPLSLQRKWNKNFA